MAFAEAVQDRQRFGGATSARQLLRQVEAGIAPGMGGLLALTLVGPLEGSRRAAARQRDPCLVDAAERPQCRAVRAVDGGMPQCHHQRREQDGGVGVPA